MRSSARLELAGALEASDRLRWTFRHRNFDPMEAGFGYELLFGVVHSSLLEEE